jgi:hypothetical protein
MTTPDQPESNPPPKPNLPPNLPPPPGNYLPNLPPPPGNYRTKRDAGRSSPARRGGPKFGILAVIGVLVVAWLAYKQFSSEPSGQHSTDQSFGPSAHRPFPAGNFSSEGDIRSVMQAFTDDWNRSDVTAIRSLWCSASVPDATILSKQIGWYGHLETSVTDIGASGDKASAEITVTYAGPRSQGGEKDPWFFVNEGGSWKPCSVSFIWTQSHGH